jgi:hypothetical protein
LVAQELLMRERRKTVSEQVYLGRIIAVGMHLPETLFQLWTSLFSMEVYQENYSPGTVEAKQFALKTLTDATTANGQGRVAMFEKIHKMTVSDEDMRPITPAEREIYKRKLRRRFLKKQTF